MADEHERATAQRFIIERTLGRGGMATVYLAHDRMLDRPVALKVLAEQLAGDEDFRRRFLREARLAAKLVHPNVVQVYDVGEGERGPHIVMEYVDGQTLADELRKAGRLPPADVVAIGVQLCSALEAAHAEQLVHRDIKPQNVLRGRSGQVKLADFGIARSLGGTRHTEIGTVLGTAAYLAPEQARGEAVTAAADIYSLGVVLYELVTGRKPIEASTLSELILKREQGAITPPSQLAPVPPSLEAVVMRCLALPPEYRPASAAELARDLVSSIDDTPTQPLRAATRRSRRPLVIAAAILLALATALAVILVESNANGDTPAAISTPTTTTTPAATSPPAALAALVRDVAAGESAGTVGPGSTQAISNQAGQAIADATAGKPNQAANDLQQAAMQIAVGLQNGTITDAEGAKLESALTKLAATLGLGTAATLKRPAPSPGFPSPAPHGHGHGHRHGHGHGHGPG